MEKATVSVIVPVFMVEDYIDRCISSIRCQTYQNIEIIVVNDGSTDESKNICIRHAAEDQRLILLNQDNKGLSAARNSGLHLAKGEYVLFVDGDDWVAPDMIETLVSHIVKNDSQICCCGHYKDYFDHSMQVIPREETLTGKRALNEWIKNQNIKMMAWGKLYRRSLFYEDTFFPVGKWFEDLAVCWKLFARSDKVTVISDCLYHYCYREGNITGTRNMKSVMDRWYASESLYNGIRDVEPEYATLAIKLCFSCIQYAWSERVNYSEEELKRAQSSYDAMSLFAKTHLRDCLKSKCSLMDKTSVLVAARNDSLSIRFYRMISVVYNSIKKSKGLPKGAGKH